MLTCSFKSLWGSNEISGRSYHYSWRPTWFYGSPCSSSAFFTRVVSVSISLFLRCAKKLQVNTAFVGSLTATDIGTGLVDFLPICEVSLEICLLRLFTSRKSSWAVDSTEGLLTAPLCTACADGLQFINAHSVCSVLLRTARSIGPLRAFTHVSYVHSAGISLSLRTCTAEASSAYLFIMAWHTDFSDLSQLLFKLLYIVGDFISRVVAFIICSFISFYVFIVWSHSDKYLSYAVSSESVFLW
jgi:hypothetical protein